MVGGCVKHYSTHFIKKLGKSLEPFFHKIQKTAKKGKKGPKRAKKVDFSKISDFYKKNGHSTFKPLWMPNFMPSFRKILRDIFLEKLSQTH